jgi:PEP-CTERM/exosortase A-associated glycosyltransferase
MRILHALHTSLPFICGYSIRSDYIIKNQVAQGLCPAVVTSAQHPNGADLKEEVAGVSFWRTPALTGRQLPGLREWRLMGAMQSRIEEAVSEWKPNIIHAHSPMLVGLPALRVGRKLGIPVVYEVRDLWENASVDRGKFSTNSPRYRVARSLETHVLSHVNGVVTICEKLRDEIAPRSGREDRVFVVGNGVDIDHFVPMADPAEFRAHWKLDGKKVVGYVGTFQPYEGLDLLVSAMTEVVQKIPNAHLMITGSGGQEKELRAQTTAFGLDEHVTFTGRLPHDEVNNVYAMADLMVYPRILTRTTALTTPLKPLEAMAMAKTVLVSDVPAMQELVDPGKTGLSFRADDQCDLTGQITHALSDPAKCAEIGKNARDWVVKERAWPTLVSKYHEIYRLAAAS